MSSESKPLLGAGAAFAGGLEVGGTKEAAEVVGAEGLGHERSLWVVSGAAYVDGGMRERQPREAADAAQYLSIFITNCL